MADVPAGILQVVETFDRNIEAYRSQEYNEAQLRREFIDPFFEELGWDITNKQGFAPQYREVIHENSIKVSGETKAPDYCFRIGGARKFFLEAKKPAVNIKADPDPAYQLRRYAWSAKLPLSILTNFETFAVYDCQIRPKHTDRATTARIINLTYKEYLDKWNEIASIFSKDAVLKGSFDKYAISPKGKRGTTTVDTEFLAEIENWRKMLARIIALRNRSLSIREINFAVQQTIDRILFLRLCEDRGIEPYGQLRATSSGDRNYPRLSEIFEKADQKYNSGLFHFHDEPGRAELPDELTLNLNIDDTPIKWILYHLYYPQSPYEFSVLPAEILGNVYEQFLGKIIRLTPGHRAVLEEKPEVKKAGGVYYTPSYIVDYIVKNTVGKLCEGKTPAQISKLKILDPACGSGSFLLGAYTYLLDYHRDWYVEHEPESWVKKKNPPIYEVTASRHCEESASDDEAISNYRLTVTEKKRILLNNIFGVDIDSQAVEVTKLSLLLKVLEGENQQTLENQYRLFHERALPDLGNNIKCGNSLIGPDFFDSLDPQSITEELRQKINPFEWQAEFPEIFNHQKSKRSADPTQADGFDAVIGNPPWVDIKGMNPDEVDYYFRAYSTTENRMNIYATFLHKSVTLLNSAGRIGFITPSSFYTQSSYTKLRTFLLRNSSVCHAIRLPDGVFHRVTAESAITIFSRKNKRECEVILFDPSSSIISISDNENGTKKVVDTEYWKHSADNKFNIFISRPEQELLYRLLKQGHPLGTLCDFSLGLTPYDKYKGHTKEQITKRVFHSTYKKDETFKPLLSGESITRYMLTWNGKSFISYGIWLGAPREVRFFKNPRIIVRQIISGKPLRIYATWTNEEYYYSQIAFGIIPKEDSNLSATFLTALINSQLITFIHKIKFLDPLKTKFQKILIQNAKQLPIPRIDFGNPDDVEKHDKMVTLVEQMLDLHKQLAAAKIPDENTRIQREIDTTDKQIDNLVYELYGLTEEEIKIVEESATGSQATR